METTMNKRIWLDTKNFTETRGGTFHYTTPILKAFHDKEIILYTCIRQAKIKE